MEDANDLTVELHKVSWVTLGERLLVEGISYRLLILTALAILIGVVGSFLVVWISFGLMNSFGSLAYALVALAVFLAFAAYSFYAGLMKRNWVMFTISFTIIGVLLLTSSTVGAVPYSTVRTFPVELTNKIFNVTFSIGPNETRTFEAPTGSFSAIYANRSLVQIRMSSTSLSLDVNMSAEQGSYDTLERAFIGYDHWDPVLNFTYHGIADEYGVVWRSYFWTPSGPTVEYGFGQGDNSASYALDIAITFHNPGNSQAQVQMQTDVFYKSTEQTETVNYHPLIDFQFAYAGIGIIGIALIPEGYALFRKKKRD